MNVTVRLASRPPEGTRWLSVALFPSFDFSMKQVMRAGEVISGDCTWMPENEEPIRNAFLIANNWRESHAYPMYSIHRSIRAYVRLCGLSGFTSARLKRMQSIRKKLGRKDFSIYLNQLQDLGGCRAIMNDMQDVRFLIRVLSDRTSHEWRRPDDYIEFPKVDGYRSYHAICSYVGKGDAAVYNRRRIEVQIRTRLQHAWATAVEGVGRARDEDFKSGEGDSDWRRLFRLASAEFALIEGSNEGEGVPPHNERVQELMFLDNKLDALNFLENLGSVVKYRAFNVADRKATYYLLTYDVDASYVYVEPQFSPREAFINYERVESLDNLHNTRKKDVVLVESSKVDNIIAAFPNYFGDVTLFKNTLSEIIKGGLPKQYRVKLPEAALPPVGQKIDVSWIRRSRFRPPRGA